MEYITMTTPTKQDNAPVDRIQMNRARALYASALAVDRKFQASDSPDLETLDRRRRLFIASARAAHLATRERTGNHWWDVRGMVEVWVDLKSYRPGKHWLEGVLMPKIGDTWTDYHGNTVERVEVPAGLDCEVCTRTVGRGNSLDLYTESELLATLCREAYSIWYWERQIRDQERKEAAKAALPLERYLETLTPFKAGQARRSLEKHLRFSTGVMTRAAWCEKHADTWTIDREARNVDGPDMVYLTFGQLTMAAVNYLDWLQSEVKGAGQ